MSASVSSNAHHYKQICFIFRKNHNGADLPPSDISFMSGVFSATEVPFAVIVEEMFLTFDHLLFLFGHCPCLTKKGKNMSKNY